MTLLHSLFPFYTRTRTHRKTHTSFCLLLLFFARFIWNSFGWIDLKEIPFKRLVQMWTKQHTIFDSTFIQPNENQNRCQPHSKLTSKTHTESERDMQIPPHLQFRIFSFIVSVKFVKYSNKKHFVWAINWVNPESILFHLQEEKKTNVKQTMNKVRGIAKWNAIKIYNNWKIAQSVCAVPFCGVLSCVLVVGVVHTPTHCLA